MLQYLCARSLLLVKHQFAHAVLAQQDSPFESPLLLSYDGGGDDGCMNAFVGSRTEWPRSVYTSTLCPGNAYQVLGTLIKLISPLDLLSTPLGSLLALPGKIMALAALGTPHSALNKAVFNFYAVWVASHATGVELNRIAADSLELVEISRAAQASNSSASPDQVGYDIAASTQAVFEEIMLELLGSLLEEHHDIDGVGLTGGCALNVRANQLASELALEHGKAMYVPAAPNDAGIAIGAAWAVTPPAQRQHLEFSGPPLFDAPQLDKWIAARKGKVIAPPQIAGLRHCSQTCTDLCIFI